MLGVAGLFQAVAALGTLIPSFIDDRVEQQFIPVWRSLVWPIYGDAPDETFVKGLAYASQGVIGACEIVIALALLGAAFLPHRRLAWANFGLALSAGLFGVFMIVVFAIDDPNLPKWYMYLAVLTWIGVTWLLVAQADRQPDAARL